MMHLEKVLKGRVRRTFIVVLGERRYDITYRGDGFGYETVFVDGRPVARHQSTLSMTADFAFELDGVPVQLSVEIPQWREFFLPLIKLSYVRLDVDGQIVYVEGRPSGRPRPEAGGLAVAGRDEDVAGRLSVDDGDGRGSEGTDLKDL